MNLQIRDSKINQEGFRTPEIGGKVESRKPPKGELEEWEKKGDDREKDLEWE